MTRRDRQKQKDEIKTGLESSKTVSLSDERICRGREFQLLGKDTQKAREAKEHLEQEGTARR